MTISNAAEAQHDQLFGNRDSTLARTDPEFVAYFDNFAFDEIHKDDEDLDATVDLHTRLLVQICPLGSCSPSRCSPPSNDLTT